jgi:Ulp1 family protease
VVWKKNQEKIKQLREKLKFVMQQSPVTTGESYCLIVPIVNLPDQVGHFFVGCFDFSMHARNFFTNVSFYDSLERNARRILRGSTAAKLVHKVNAFFNNFVLHEPVHRHLQQSDGAILRMVLYESCPEQLNGFDCGIFAVTVCLHFRNESLLTEAPFRKVMLRKLGFYCPLVSAISS